MKPLKVTDRLNESIEVQELEGPIEKAIAKLEAIRDRYMIKDNYLEVRLRADYHDEGGHREYYLDAARYETDEEIQNRIDCSMNVKNQKKKETVARKERELKELARLKKKYEKGDGNA